MGLADIREQLGGSREEQDAALMQLALTRQIALIPEENQKTLTGRDRDAALQVGGEPNHLIRVEPVRAPDPAARAVARQAAIDISRGRAMFLAELDEALANGTDDPQVLRRMVQTGLARHKTAGPGSEAIVSAAEGPDSEAALRRAIDDVAASWGLRRDEPGTGYDPTAHEATDRPRKGQRIHVVRPGYSTTIDGENIRLTKTVVETADPPSLFDPPGARAEGGVLYQPARMESEASRIAGELKQMQAKRDKLLAKLDQSRSTSPYLTAEESRIQRQIDQAESRMSRLRRQLDEVEGVGPPGPPDLGDSDVPRMSSSSAGAYQGFGQTMNRDLRTSGVTQRFAGMIRDIDRDFAEAAPLQRPLRLFRGVGGHEAAEQIFGPTGTRIGQIVKEPGFISASTVEEPTESYGGREVLVRIRVPAGNKALRLQDENWGGAVLGEVVLPRDTGFKLVGDMTEPSGRRVIDLEVLPS